MARQCAGDLAEAIEALQGAQSRIAKIEDMLKGVITNRDALKSSREKAAVELKKLAAERREAATLADATKEALRQATDIVAGKPYFLQCVFGREAFPELMQNWRLSGIFLDLPRCAKDTCQHFVGCDDAADKKAFWMKFLETSGPQLFYDRMKQLAKLQQMAKPAIEGLCSSLWPNAPSANQLLWASSAPLRCHSSN